MNKSLSIGVVLTPRIGRLDTPYLAGTERVFLSDIQSLKKKGYSVFPFARNYSSSTRQLYYPIQMFTWLTGNSYLTNIIESLLEFLGLFLFAIHAPPYDIFIGYSTPFLALFRPRKTLICMHTNYDLPFARFFASRYKNAHFVFCSQAMRRRYIKKYPFLQSASSVLYNSVDTAYFHPSRTLRAPSPHPFRLLFTGAWVPEKGLHLLLEALKLLPPHMRANTRLTIASGESLWYSDFPKQNNAYVQQIRNAAEGQSNIFLLGGTPSQKMPQLYRSHDALVVPSLWEDPCPLSILESLACGTPTISFNSGGIKELIDGTQSLQAPSKTAKALAETLRLAYKNRRVFKNHSTSLLSTKKPFTHKARIQAYANLIQSFSHTT
jgi:glycosyltransferase involved in cell wall biosynthesis